MIASFVGEFLPRDMNHVYRQVAGLKAHRSLVLTRKRSEAERFSFPEEDISLLPKPLARGLRRVWYRQLRGRPVACGRGEVQRVLEVLHERGAKLLHVYLADVAATLLPLFRRLELPLVISVHGSDLAVEGTRRPGFRKALEETLSHADLVLARSESLRDQAIALGVSPERVELQRTGVPLADWPFEERRDPSDGKWKLIQAGRFVEKKGLLNTVKAFARVAEEFPSSELVLCGDGPLRSRILEEAVRHGVAEKISFPGFLTSAELRSEMEQSHVYLHPSETTCTGDREGVPNAMLEAMAGGLPVVATRHGGIPEVIEHGVEGFLVTEGDSPALAKAIISLLQPKVAASFGKKAREAVEQKFDSMKRVRELESRYAKLIQEGGLS